ncbi:hypothetical protein IWQ62_002323 [Dispira parvispora]|uniref:Uncharacterized protein n=1 Tax=Dispira parvispora TaxID=1520584 RepID=A0A9W8E3Y8_9FUNG|nr:hypothetical protein IWQ62_002323 [Dispira parvispora]
MSNLGTLRRACQGALLGGVVSYGFYSAIDSALQTRNDHVTTGIYNARRQLNLGLPQDLRNRIVNPSSVAKEK